MELIAGLLQAILTWVGITTNNEAQDIRAYEQHIWDNQARDWQHNERIDQNVYAQQMHEFNTANDPRIQMSAYRGLGMSQSAALQAIAGSPSTSWNPSSGVNGSAPNNPLPNYNPSLSGYVALGQGLNNIFDNILKTSETEKNRQDIVYSKQMVEESNARIIEIGHKMGIDDQYIQLATALNNSVIGLNTSQETLNYAKLNEVNMQVEKLFSEILNIDADTINKYLEASKINAETLNIQADTAYKEALTTLTNEETKYVQSQTEGQNLANEDQRIIGSLRKARYEVSKVLGVDVDADLTTQYLMAMATGNYNSIARLIEAKQNTDQGQLSYYANSKSVKKMNKTLKKSGDKKITTRRIYEMSPSFEGTWNPFE